MCTYTECAIFGTRKFDFSEVEKINEVGLPIIHEVERAFTKLGAFLCERCSEQVRKTLNPVSKRKRRSRTSNYEMGSRRRTPRERYIIIDRRPSRTH